MSTKIYNTNKSTNHNLMEPSLFKQLVGTVKKMMQPAVNKEIEGDKLKSFFDTKNNNKINDLWD